MSEQQQSVEDRLRAMQNGTLHLWKSGELQELCGDAAAVIERLRVRNEELERDYVECVMLNGKMKDALRAIVTAP